MPKFDKDPLGRFVYIDDKPYTFEVLHRLESMAGLDEETRAMAEAALRFAGAEKPPEPEPESDTIATIDGVKVKMKLLTRDFFIRLKDITIRGKSLGDLERMIRNK